MTARLLRTLGEIDPNCEALGSVEGMWVSPSGDQVIGYVSGLTSMNVPAGPYLFTSGGHRPLPVLPPGAAFPEVAW